MKKIVIVLNVLAILSLSACDTGSMSKNAILHICASYAVPGMFCSEYKGTDAKCTVIEEDSYGRTLFSYSTMNIITDNKDTVLVIFQKNDRDYIYFYEDICYIDATSNEAEIEYFKYINDWNKAFNSEKFSKRPKKLSFDLVVINENKQDLKTVSKKCAETLNVSEDIISMRFDDYDLKGNVIYILCYEENGSYHKYFVLVNEEYECSTYKIPENGHVDFTDFTKFKYSNGWNT